MNTQYFTCRNGARLAYVDIGKGPVIAWSHGLLMSKAMYGAQIEAFSAHYRCVAWDHPGQGESDVLPGSVASIDTCAEMAAELIEGLQLGPVRFVGLSMGGFVGMRLAARRPELIHSLCNLATTSRPEPTENISKYRRLNWAARLFGVQRFLAAQVLPILFGSSFCDDPQRADDREFWTRQLMSSNSRRVYRAVNGVLQRQDITDEVGCITAPTLQLHGEQDRAIPVHRAESTARAIPGARLQVLPGTGHSMTIETPEAVTQALRTFFDSVD